MSEAYHYPEHFNLVTYPHPVLRRQADAVETFDAGLESFCQSLLVMMRQSHGVGLAAPQVAVSRAIFVTDHASMDGQAEMELPRIWINPRIEEPQGQTTYEEGCLSFPGLYGRVERYQRFVACWQDTQGQEHRESLDVEQSALAIIFQHELDHLQGRLFVDYLTPAQLTLLRRRLREMEREYKDATGQAGALLRR